MLKYGEHVRKACKMHAECMHLAVTTRHQLKQLYTYYIRTIYRVHTATFSDTGYFGIRLGRVRGAFGERSGSIWGAFGVRSQPKQVYSRPSGSLYRCTYDNPGHFTGVFTMSRVTLQVYPRYPGSFYRCIHDIPGHFTGVFTMPRVTFAHSFGEVYSRFPGSLYRCIHDTLCDCVRICVCVCMFVWWDMPVV